MPRKTIYQTRLENARKRSKDLRSTTQIIKEATDAQIPEHRQYLFILICILTVLSFLLLSFTVLFQLWKRLSYPEYQGVSDQVISILAIGVFAELVGVIGIIARLLWQKQ